MLGFFIKFGRISSSQTTNIPSKLDRGNLHSETYSEIGGFVFACILGSQNFTLGASFSKSARNEDSIDIANNGLRALLFEIFSIDLNDVNPGVVLGTGDGERFVN